jgi:4-amino-4-deoxy-L-arabinose transferase-like glycosyltransferase
LAITAVAVALRLYRLGRWSFFHEEMYMLQALENPNSYRLTWPRISLALIDLSTRVFGTSEWSTRLAPALIGALSVPILYALVNRTFDRRTAWISALLLAVSPWHLTWSQSARFYSSVMLLCTLATFALFWAIERDRPAFILAFYALLFVATTERAFSLLVVPAVAAYLVLLWIMPLERPRGLRARNLVLLSLPVVLWAGRDAYRLLGGEWFTLSETFELFAGEVTSNPLRLSSATAYQLGIPLICTGVGGGICLLTRKSRQGLLVLMGAVFPLFTLSLLSLFVPTRNRYAFLVLPFWIILAASSVTEMLAALAPRRKVLGWTVLAVLLLGALSQCFLYYTFESGDRSNWRAAFDIVRQEKLANDAIWSTYPELGAYYLDQDVESVADLDADARVTHSERNWFVIDEATRQNQTAAYRWIRENCALFDVIPGHSTARNLRLDIYLCPNAR